ncbi:Swt1 family HEPN domain-containing protein [Cellulomonas edaphi]|uniref:Swt1 family HEPN domain-containing protein n=1 Tax=Cellulomonas edaphi TaxID=3053468 RepID=A0ABT7S572_9CELL|nr:Swt1 family HEPN domain-containing protein [Cellulomons edaphi]MDM7830768.1 Swt1 family HEPN domain-containing protein [Cellulomons edaphi]
MARDDGLKIFLMTAQLMEEDLDTVEQDLALDLGRARNASTGEAGDYYPQIEHAFRAEAKEMAPHYEVFYSLERTIRALVADSLEAADGAGWWNDPSRVSPRIKDDCEARLKKEEDTGVTLRSEDPLDFSTFGELGQIITSNWDVFGALFKSEKAVTRIMANLNTLRGPIAHCTLLAEDEVVRLRLSVRDWFRQME